MAIPFQLLKTVAEKDDKSCALNHSNVINLGSSLSPSANHTLWLSPSGLFAFGFYQQGDGFLIGIWLIHQTEKTIIWTANRDDLPVSSNASLDLTRDGKLLLKIEQGIEKLIPQMLDPAPIVSAAMLDSGNFVLYGNDFSVIWESFDFPTDTILGGQNLSSRNLVGYPVNSSAKSDDAYWSSNTPNSGLNVQLILSHIGILFLSGGDLREHILAYSSYPSKNRSAIHRATLDADGIFRLYLHRFESSNGSDVLLEWPALSNLCEVKGICGFNSYCSSMGNKDVCECYPGFHFINASKKFLGCYKNSSDNDCRRSKYPSMLYSIVPLENMGWSDYPYSVVQMEKEDCCKSCLDDCNCGAVLYTGDKCTKFKLPLRYGRVSDNFSYTSFFKVVRDDLRIPLPDHNPPLAPTVLTESKRSLILILSISLGSISCFCFIFAIYSFFRYRRQLFRYRRLLGNANFGLTEELTLRSFSNSELEKATDDFKEELGRGSFGAVYKGTISEGNKAIAVKRLEKVVEEGQREFRAEMTAIARTHQRNLIRLLGFCIEGSRKLLGYEFMSNGSLADLLFKAEMRPIWKERVRIALDVAKGILYLHEECEVRIIHCNIKPQNILLDDTWSAKISDFGLAKLLVPNQSRTTMGIEAKAGYLAPEWKKNALVSVKADTYSFHIVLLEIVCCRSSIEINVPMADEIILSTWVYNCYMARE
ncbi:G-type lectin S-receptor-like serine/threonine-protein kinase LECRK1 [Quercus robur]|uniref:G-type lectin S-receptor-like serine/threonine-protein kinase LECRK1 n=1 Tax=Quercus robur TaxID=38942 RepID=UPI0021619908|nr:G-type lectin S-receptor-like serine/threonine-protein kinase LECRK1 [Quercus robur]